MVALSNRMVRGVHALLLGVMLGGGGLVQAQPPQPGDESAYLEMVDPELRAAALERRKGMAAFEPMTIEKLATRRKWIAGLQVTPLPGIPFEKHIVPREGGEPPVTVYAVNPMPGKSRPAILHIHGGGLTASSAVASLPAVQELAATLDVPIVTVEYRLAPETSYKGSIGDNYAALRWMRSHAAALGIDPERIAVFGESAGGAHAALLALHARDRDEVKIAFMALIYPMLDDRTGSTRRVPAHLGYFGWNGEANRFGWQSFLNMAPGGPDVPSEAVPMRAKTLTGLPPTYIAVGGLDVLTQENIEFAARLVESGVNTELVVVPGAFHGFDSLAKDAAISRRFTAMKIDALRRGLGLDIPRP